MLFRRAVTHRIDVARRGATLTFEIQGLLDGSALAALQASVAAARMAGSAVRIVLRAGTQLDRECVAALRAMEADLVAESPYLARWIAGSGDATVLHDPETGATSGAATVDAAARGEDPPPARAGRVPGTSGHGAASASRQKTARRARRERG